MFKIVFISLITLYQKLISPLCVGRCCFHPTCSEYAKQAIQQYGTLKGSYLSIKRLSKCHPFSTPAIDPVPHNHA
ncbi:membrane protein insertion efficiency factor YidD [Candidatus Marinamargulisbacteria bacterium SCGC AG-414-C22]|nr:membrane protein insertion efficiency factor YidD [Candidatus Marinamargulisbacteria bacterium SCGC AG-414-C22]